MSETILLESGTRVKTGGVTYEVTKTAEVAAGLVPVLPQATRLLKVFCPTDGYTARITQRWISRGGAPDCPMCKVAMLVEVKATEKAVKPRKGKTSEMLAAELEIDAPTVETDMEPLKTETDTDELSTLARLLSDIDSTKE